MGYLRTAGLLLSCMVFLTSARANVTLTLEVASHTEPKSSSNVPKDRQDVWEVVWGEKWVLLRSDKEVTLLDFDKRRRVVADLQTKTQVNYSLYDTVGFRLLELRNRNMLGKAMAAAKIADVADVGMSALNNQHALAIQETPEAPLLAKTDGADEVFLDGSTEFFRRSSAGTSVSAEDARMFAKVFRYVLGGHPQILEAMARSDAIPSRFVLTTYNAQGTTTRRVSVTSVTRTREATRDFPVFPTRPASASTDPVERVLDRAEAITPAESLAARQAVKDAIATALREGRILDAYLNILEWTVMTGEPLPPLSEEQKGRFQADATAMQMARALTARTKEELSAAIKTFEETRQAVGSKAYVLKIFEANNRALLGDSVAARKLFLEVLDAHPHVTGVYKDLGDVELTRYNMAGAWRSWDLGRRMEPQFRTLKAVTQWESTLATGHPEFF